MFLSARKKEDPYTAEKVCQHVKLIVVKWGRVTAIPPDKFLMRILSLRGYPSDMIPSMTSRLRVAPTSSQIENYDTELVSAVRQSDLAKLKALEGCGRNLRACNRYGESILHMACRRAEIDVVKYIVDNVSEPWIIDDFGRTPLHDACWRPEPRFDIVTVILDKNLDLLRFVDIRGSNPLNYVRREHWLQWCAYLFHLKDKYWK
jgi:ankyrin repeat protein